MKALSYENEVRINFLKAVKPGEFEAICCKTDQRGPDVEERLGELFRFSDRILFDSRNCASLHKILPPNPIVGLWRFFFINQPDDKDLISDNPRVLKFKDYQTGIIYEISKAQLMPLP